MAVVLDSLSGGQTKTTFIKPPDTVREWTAMPRALINFDILNGVISAKPENDSQELIISMTLDPTFAYRFLELAISLEQNQAANWQRQGYLELTNAIRGQALGATQHHLVPNSVVTRVPQGANMWISHPDVAYSLPRYVIQQRSIGAAPVITFKAVNTIAAVATAGTVNFHCTWMEFDIEQAERFPIHWPALVYTR